jgi:hypothetical protein
MRAIRSFSIALFLPIAAYAASLPKECGTNICPASTCSAGITAASTAIPEKPCPRFGSDQDDVDVYSWNEFIAYNWPATQSCKADQTKSILGVKSGANGPVLWQAQMSTDDVFVAKGQHPKGWCNMPTLFTAAPRAFHHIAKADPAAKLLGADFARVAEPVDPTQAGGGILTDANGRWVRYEKLINLTELQYITSHNLWNKAGLAGKTVDFTVGSTEFKASWKVLTPAEKASGRYYTTVATVFNTPSGDPSPIPGPVTLGLVGLHIVHKTTMGFFWTTFEQVDNDKVFVDPSNPMGPNIQTAKSPYVEIDPVTKKPTAKGVNVKRMTPIPVKDDINNYYRGLLAGSVFANYRLIGTQWQFNLNTGGFPQYLANITLETYVQTKSRPNPKTPGPKRQALTGCLYCHGVSPWDDSFVFIEAK